jgi:hypothetical protein
MNHSATHSDITEKFKRDSVAERRVGANNRCKCGESRVKALVGKSGVCVRCQRSRAGKSTFDEHHVAGRRNCRTTVAVPVNDHRARLSEDQRNWPNRTLENPEGCPLLTAAACIRGFIDMVHYLIDEFLFWIAEMLEALSPWLRERLGPRWWVKMPVEGFSKGK